MIFWTKSLQEKIRNFDLNFLAVKSGEYSDISDFDDSDDMLVKASQDAEIKTTESFKQKTPKFFAPLSDD